MQWPYPLTLDTGALQPTSGCHYRPAPVAPVAAAAKPRRIDDHLNAAPGGNRHSAAGERRRGHDRRQRRLPVLFDTRSRDRRATAPGAHVDLYA